jgi:hypothetical protein
MRNSMMMAALVLGLAACGKKDDGGAKPAPTAAAPAAGSGTAAAPAAGSGTAAAAPGSAT